jgi:Fur family peroxide stress response transcriptional regulator
MSEPNTRLQELVSSVRSQGHRLTPQRMAVLRILSESDAHPSAQDIYQEVQAAFPMTSLATVYKTITLLKEMGQVLELGFSDDSSRYDGRQNTPHPHLICVRCKTIVDWESDILSDLDGQVARMSGYLMIGHRLDLLGLCPDCQRKSLSGDHNPRAH